MCSHSLVLFLRTNLLVVLAAAWLTPAVAQPPFGGGRGGGFSRGDRGGSGERGDDDRGGDRSGGRGRDWGGRGGGRGGFDPSSMLQRFDRNGNGMIDMDERDGPVGFIIGRLKRENPSLDTDRPIPLSKLSEGFQQLRSGRDSSGDNRSRGGDRASDDENALEATMLVPGFGIPPELLPAPVLGFGPSAELFDVDVRPEDIQEAEERLRRYDRNRDGVLTKEEISSRWEGDPMDFDRNKDGKLTASELAIRYARRRQGSDENADRGRDRRRGDDRQRDRDEEIPDPYDGRKSLRLGGRPLVDGLPDWFSDRDANADGQVMMNEYTTTWSDDLVSEFFQLDANQDGTITAREATMAKAGGTSPGSAAGADADSGEMASRSRSPSAGGERGSGRAAASEQPSEKYLEYATRIISRNDANKDGALVASEWKGMLIDPQPADADRDGRITTEEYAGWLQNRQ